MRVLSDKTGTWFFKMELIQLTTIDAKEQYTLIKLTQG